MAKMRSGKKKLLIVLAVLLIILIAVIIIKNVNKEGPETPPVQEEQRVNELPSTTYRNMEVRKVEMEYLKDNNQTMITMEFNNVTNETIQNEALEVIWINEDEEVIGRMPTHIEKLEPGEQYSISVVHKGDLTATKQIKLEKK